MIRFRHSAILSLILGLFLVVFTSCKKDDGGTGPVGDNSDIPADPGGTAPATVINNVSPAATFARTPGNESRIQVNLLGVIDPTTGLPITLTLTKPGGPLAQNIFITEDNILQGFKLTRAGTGNVLLADVVFEVDNSGSMFEEADSIASKIIEFVSFLQASGLDLRVGSVGYYGIVNGAINLTTASGLSAYLQRNTGTSRTVGFGGADSARLATEAVTFASGHPSFAENGIVGIAFADTFFTWRAGAQRIHVNFTDEGTQPSNMPYWSSAGLCARWTPAKGTIHTVFSSDTNQTWTPLNWERPWELSVCSGGTMKFIPSNAAGLDLRTLPVAGALSNSYRAEFVTANPSGTHTVVVTVKTSTADGKTTYQNITY